SWQIVPSIMLKFLADPDREKAARVMQAMMKMVKLDIAALQAAYDGRG
ncbi:MAG: VOC family protein, partial [Rhizobiaceae bacterium]